MSKDHQPCLDTMRTFPAAAFIQRSQKNWTGKSNDGKGSSKEHIVTSIYHITHIDNLHEILSHGGLWSDSEMSRQGFFSVCIAYRTLKERRTRTPVPLSTGKTLAEYVPFYFCNRSPMLYAIHCGMLENDCPGQDEIIYFVSSAEKIDGAGLEWCFTDGHAVEVISSYYNSINDLSEVDWEVIKSWSWRNRDDDFDRKRRKQAEFLVYRFFPWNLIDSIAVMDNSIESKVTGIISTASYKPVVKIEKEWYY